MNFKRKLKLFFNNKRTRIVTLPMEITDPIPIFNEKYPGWTGWEDLTKARSR